MAGRLIKGGATIGTGIALGIALGVALDSLALGIALSAAFGAVFTVTKRPSSDRDDENPVKAPISREEDGG